MKTRILFFVVLTTIFFSCTQSRYATVGAYESDDAYYTAGDTYISDFALVDDEAQMATASDSATTSYSSDDYYDPNYLAPAVYSPNSSANNCNTSAWNGGYNSCNSYCGSGFGNYQYGSYWNSSPYMMPGIGWNPYSGYYSSFNLGYNPFYNPYYNPYLGYNPYNSWYTPYYSPYYYSGWAYNPWYSPYNYNNSNPNDGASGSLTIHGPRNPISTISATNSSYTGGLFYNGTKRDLHTFANDAQSTSKPDTSVPASIERPENTKPTQPTFERPSYKPTERPTYRPSKPANDRNVIKPGLTKPRETAPARDRNHTAPAKPSQKQSTTPRNTSPAREHKPAYNTEPSQRTRTESPARETTRSSPNVESSPSRGSGSNSSPSKSGGSSSSPRRK